MRRWIIVATALLVASTAGCSRAREYELRGQVLAVDPVRQEITVRHEDISGFMPGMTMPFKVRDDALLQQRTPGELIRATLVVEDTEAYLKGIERAGHAPLIDVPSERPRFDLLAPGEAVPDADFLDQAGRRRTLSEWRGGGLVVTFIYTRCPVPNFCPLMDRHFNALQQQIAADPALRGRVHLLSVSFDPEFDTPPILAEHAKKAGADPAAWSFVTGERDEIDRFASRFGVSIIRESDPSAEIVHSLRTAVVDSEGRLQRVFSGNDWEPGEVLAELRVAGGNR